MNSKPVWSSVTSLVIITCLLAGCGTNTVTPIHVTKLEDSYGTAFQKLEVPSDQDARARGSRRELPTFTQQEIWNASLAVAMQVGPIVRIDRDQGRIVAPPYVLLLVSRDQHIVLYCTFMNELYYDRNDPNLRLFWVKVEEQQQYAEDVLDRVVTQASVRKNLGPNGKWKFLSE